jgi:uncharacterized protein DUF4386
MKVSVRTAGIAGIAFFVLIALPGFVTGSPPDPGDPATKFLSYATDHRSGIIAAGYLGVAANFFALAFLAGLIVALRRLGASPLLLVAAFGGLLLAGAANAAGTTLTLSSAFRLNGSQHIDAESVRMLTDASAISFTMIAFPIALFMLASGLMMQSARLFPNWLALVGMIGAAVELVGTLAVFSTTGAFSPEGPLGLVLGLLPFGIFVLATSIVMVMRGAAMESAEGATAAVAA